jgi:hypothetical protein
VQDFLDSAEAACSKPREEHPFLCVDLTFIAGMLHHGYRLAADAKLGTVIASTLSSILLTTVLRIQNVFPGSGSKDFSTRIRILHFFIPDLYPQH